MSRVFSIRTVLRQTPNRLVRQFLERLGHADLEVPWDQLGARDIEPVVEALNDLSATEFDLVEGHLHTVFDLACASGAAAIRDMRACETGDEPGPELPADANLYEQAMWAWLHWPTAVEQALLVHQIDHLNWWRRRDDLPRREPDASPAACEELAQRISAILRAVDGRGRNCTVEPFARRGTTCYFAFPDDHVVTATAHDDDGRLAPRTFRRTFTLVFAFDPAEGALELYAKVPAAVKRDLERAFARAVLNHELGAWNPDPSYEPNALWDRDFRTVTDPDDHVSVDVRQVRLSFVTGGRQITLRGDPEHPGDAARMIGEVLDAERVPPSAVHVTLLTFHFQFHPVGRRRGGAVTFDVAYPNSCSLRNQRPERVAVIMKYLSRWGIYAARPAGPDLGAA